MVALSSKFQSNVCKVQLFPVQCISIDASFFVPSETARLANALLVYSSPTFIEFLNPSTKAGAICAHNSAPCTCSCPCDCANPCSCLCTPVPKDSSGPVSRTHNTGHLAIFWELLSLVKRCLSVGDVEIFFCFLGSLTSNLFFHTVYSSICENAFSSSRDRFLAAFLGVSSYCVHFRVILPIA